jgi:hypothetical protein
MFVTKHPPDHPEANLEIVMPSFIPSNIDSRLADARSESMRSVFQSAHGA